MKRYTTLLFDADRTLFDFDAAERDAFGIVMDKFGIQYTDADFEHYVAVNNALWEQLGKGEITKKYLQDNRFGIFFDSVGRRVNVSSSVLNTEYVDELANVSKLFRGALSLCRKLSEHYDMYIVTNGVSHTQKKRFYLSPIHSYFKDIFVSEDADAAKPKAEYFDYVFAHIGENKRAASVIIGDSLSHDILGGNNYGIDTIWYNPKNTENTTGIIPTKTVKDYAELLELLL